MWQEQDAYSVIVMMRDTENNGLPMSLDSLRLIPCFKQYNFFVSQFDMHGLCNIVSMNEQNIVLRALTDKLLQVLEAGRPNDRSRDSILRKSPGKSNLRHGNTLLLGKLLHRIDDGLTLERVEGGSPLVVLAAESWSGPGSAHNSTSQGRPGDRPDAEMLAAYKYFCVQEVVMTRPTFSVGIISRSSSR
jgi:hypothetical protein